MSVVPWKRNSDIALLSQLFFSESQEERLRAVDITRAYLIRGRVPPSIEATALLTAAQIQDQQGCDDLCARTAYSFAIIKFVNGLLDPYQKSTHAIPLHQIARKIGLPSLFVEARHVATHELLPSLALLRRTVHDALAWLKENFWEENVLSEKKEYEKRASEQEKTTNEVKEALRVYRRFHRGGIKLSLEINAKTDEAGEYRKRMEVVKNVDKESILLDVLVMKNVLIPKKEVKFAQLRALYTPLLAELNKFKPGFTERLFGRILDCLAEMGVDEALLFLSESEALLAVKWCVQLVLPKFSKPDFSAEAASQRLSKVNGEWIDKVIEALKEKGLALEERGGETKRRKVDLTFYWQENPEYVPTPFGVAI